MKTDRAYRVRKNFGIVCDLKEVDNEKKANEDYQALSVYDNANLNIYSISRLKERDKLIRPSSHEFVKRNINCGSYLDLRKTVTSFKKNEVERMHQILTGWGSRIELNQVKNAFLPPTENKNYSKYFLPLPGYGLIARPEDPVKKKKKIKKK
jgi:hypothetical protein